MAAATLYPGKINSPPTFLTAPYTVGDGLLNVDDTGVFPAAPNIVTVAASATDITAVTYIYTGIGVNQLTGVTLLEGTDKDWPINTPCARNFTNYDWQGVIDRFHATTGHKHTAAANDGPQLDHGQLGGLTDDDHVRYFDKDCTKALTDAYLCRNVDDSSLGLWGGIHTVGHAAIIDCSGSDRPTIGGYIRFIVPNAAKTGHIIVMQIPGVTDTPYLDMLSHQIKAVAAPTTAGDALIYQAWAAWTPTLTWGTGTPSTITTVARWTQVGKIVFFEFQVQSADSNGTTGLTFTLPATHANNGCMGIFPAMEWAVGATPAISIVQGYCQPASADCTILNFVTGIDGQIIQVRVSGFYEVE